MQEKIAVIDIGSNTVKYSLFVRQEEEGKYLPKKIGGSSRTVRFLHFIRDGAVLSEGMERLAETLLAFREEIEGEGLSLSEIVCVATAGFRKLSDPDAAVKEVRARTGISIRLLSGYEEAKLSFAGLLCRTGAGKGAMLDMGGGSTELILFDQGELRFSVSMPFGSLSLQEQFCKGEFPDDEEAAQIRSFVAEHLRLCGGRTAVQNLFGSGAHPNVYIVGGSAKAIAARHAELFGRSYNGNDSYGMTREDFRAQLGCYLRGEELPLERLRECFPDRYRVIVPGMLAYEELFDGLLAGVVLVSKGGIRDGIAASVFDGRIPLSELQKGPEVTP